MRFSDAGILSLHSCKQLIYALNPHFMLIYVKGGVGPSCSRCLQNGVRSAEPDENILKAGFHFFRSTFDPNTLQEISRTKRKYAQECLRGNKWVLKS